MKADESLIEWTVFYVKNNDLIRKEIIDYTILKNFVSFEFKDGKVHTYYVLPEVDNSVLSDLMSGWKSVVCLNKVKNLKFLVENWDELIGNPKLSFIFVHPTFNQRWVVFPHIHDKITDEESLKTGLRSLFESVPRV